MTPRETKAGRKSFWLLGGLLTLFLLLILAIAALRAHYQGELTRSAAAFEKHFGFSSTELLATPTDKIAPRWAARINAMRLPNGQPTLEAWRQKAQPTLDPILDSDQLDWFAKGLHSTRELENGQSSRGEQAPHLAAANDTTALLRFADLIEFAVRVSSARQSCSEARQWTEELLAPTTALLASADTIDQILGIALANRTLDAIKAQQEPCPHSFASGGAQATEAMATSLLSWSALAVGQCRTALPFLDSDKDRVSRTLTATFGRNVFKARGSMLDFCVALDRAGSDPSLREDLLLRTTNSTATDQVIPSIMISSLYDLLQKREMLEASLGLATLAFELQSSPRVDITRLQERTRNLVGPMTGEPLRLQQRPGELLLEFEADRDRFAAAASAIDRSRHLAWKVVGSPSL